MKLRLAVVVFCSLAVVATHVVQGSGAPVRTDVLRQADLAGIEKFHKQEIAATLSRDPVALTDLWTDDAVRLGSAPPAEVGRQVIFESNQRQTANKDFMVLSYIPEYKELIFLNGAWAVEWRPFTGSFITSPGGAPVHVRGRLLIVYKKMPDGNWKCFRVAGIID